MLISPQKSTISYKVRLSYPVIYKSCGGVSRMHGLHGLIGRFVAQLPEHIRMDVRGNERFLYVRQIHKKRLYSPHFRGNGPQSRSTQARYAGGSPVR